MKRSIVPAQITTVEDKIAGVLSLMQILLLSIPVVFLTLVYVLFAPVMSMNIAKWVIALVILILCMILALRIDGKIVVDWLKIILAYQAKAKYYVWDKNSMVGRVERKKNIKKYRKKSKEKINNNIERSEIDDYLIDKIAWQKKVKFRYQFNKKR